MKSISLKHGTKKKSMPLKRYDPLAGTQYAERTSVIPTPVRVIEPPKPTPIIAVEVDRNAAIMAEITRLKAENERLRLKKMGKPTVVTVVTQAVKEAWQMTLSEYEKKYGKPSNGATSYCENTQHKNAVGVAVNQGKPVPQEVLKDYPDLKPSTPQVVEPVSNVVPMPVKPLTPLEQRIAANPASWPLWRQRIARMK